MRSCFISGITIAVTQMEKMVHFYNTVFDTDLAPKELFGSTLHAGLLGPIKLLLCPRELARNTAVENRHQFDIVVADIHTVMSKVIAAGGRVDGEVIAFEGTAAVTIYDPDDNSIVLNQT
jgi:predicted enzyme related to lactoylglutathione lyase